MSKRIYVVDSLIPAYQLHLLSGASGAGKTTLVFQQCRDLLDGKPWFGHAVHPPKKFAYLACDRALDEYEEKFELMGIEPFPIHSILQDKSFKPRNLAKPEVRERYFLEIWQQLGEPDFLVVDPISPFLTSNLKDYHAVMDSLIGFTRFCTDHLVTIQGLHHAGKLAVNSGFMRAQDRTNGSGGLLGYSGTQMFLTDALEDPKQPGHHTFTINPHNSECEHHKIVRNKQGIFVPWVEADTVATDENLLALIPYEPETIESQTLVNRASESLDKSDKTIRNLLTGLKKESRITSPVHGTYSRKKLIVN